MKSIVIAIFIFVILFASANIASPSNVETVESIKQQREAFYYLNYLRTSTGLNFLFQNDLLNEASLNHANYLVTNGKFGHLQDSLLPGFSGKKPLERIYSVGYKSTQIIENISSNANNYRDSIDGLFSAIYHRFS